MTTATPTSAATAHAPTSARRIWGMVGKWHLDPGPNSRHPEWDGRSVDPYRPRNRGFEDYWHGSMNTYEANYRLDGRTIPDAPMVGGKGMQTDGGLRVPFLAAWPGVIPGGRVFDENVWSLDASVTILAAADASSFGIHIDGTRPATHPAPAGPVPPDDAGAARANPGPDPARASPPQRIPCRPTALSVPCQAHGPLIPGSEE